MSVSLPIGWLQHAPVLSVLLPLFTAVTLLLMGDRRVGVSESTATRNDAPMRWQRRISLGSSVLGLVMAVALVLHAASGGQPSAGGTGAEQVGAGHPAHLHQPARSAQRPPPRHHHRAAGRQPRRQPLRRCRGFRWRR